jgi:hypothetical protein
LERSRLFSVGERVRTLAQKSAKVGLDRHRVVALRAA